MSLKTILSMILLIDNNDSFTHNIVDMLRRISTKKVYIVSSSILDIDSVSTYECVIISPGASLPKDYPILTTLLEQYIGVIPILGVCLGYQAICQFLGAELFNYSSPRHGVETQIECDRESVLFDGIESMTVGRYHSWVAKNLPKELKITATDSNGDIMAMENREMKIFGVQFHPESYITKSGDSVLINFLNEATK